MKIRTNFRTALRWFLGVLFIWAAISKLANPSQFHASIVAYEMPLPDVLTRLAAMTMPWLELFCGLMLLANVWIESALALTLLMYAGFICATGQAWVRGLDISCGCFDLRIIGLDAHSPTVMFIDSARFAFFRNIALTGAAVHLLISALRRMRGARAEAPMKGSG